MTADEALHLAGYMYVKDRHADAENVLLKQLVSSPSDYRILYNLALLRNIEGDFDKATEYCEQAFAAAPGAREVADLLAHQRLRDGRWDEGFELFEARFTKPTPIPSYSAPCPLWDGALDRPRRLLIWCEQGLGDTVQFARFLPTIRERGQHVTVVAQAELRDLFQESGIADQVFPSEEVCSFVENKGDNFYALKEGFIQEYGIDAHLPIVSLARCLKVQPERLAGKVPYLRVSPSRVDRARQVLDRVCPTPGLRVGITWAGSSSPHLEFGKMARRRNVDLARLAPVLSVEGVHFLSFQKGLEAAARFEFPRIVDPGLTDSYADTAALLCGVDVLLTVDTSIAHVAGALGARVWLMDRWDHCWRWFRGRADSPWYPTMRIFRQTGPGDWESVAAQLVRALREIA